jgi:hypothetical protein
MIHEMLDLITIKEGKKTSTTALEGNFTTYEKII